jgi:regulator of chromosome condensation
MLIPNLSNITSLSVGADFALALDKDGTVYAWGNGAQNELGHRVFERHATASLLPSLAGLPRKKFRSIHAGSNHAFAVDKAGDTWAWGNNNYGQTGIKDGAGEANMGVCPPRKVPSLLGRDVTAIATGLHHSLALTRAGDVLAWGRLDGAQIGLPLAALPLDDPHAVIREDGRAKALMEPAVVPVGPCLSIATGSDHNLAVSTDGHAFSWGFNVSYQCGQGPDTDDVAQATRVRAKDLEGRKVVWAGAGGQYSMLGAVVE